VALRGRGWELVERLRALDRAQGEEYSLRLNRAPTHELPGLLEDLAFTLAKLTGSPVEIPSLDTWIKLSALPDGGILIE
jgi:hypothetical protein